MIIILALTILFLLYSRRKMMKGYQTYEDHFDQHYDSYLAPETNVEYERH